MHRFVPFALALSACTTVPHPERLQPTPDPEPFADFAAFVSTPGPIRHEAHLSARWSVARKGLIDLTDPAAAHLPADKMDIVLPVHVFEHPTAGTWVVDTGIGSELAGGGKGPLRGLVRMFLGGMEPVASLESILAGRTPAGVLLTHTHLDHVLGLPDLGADVPVYVGPEEGTERSIQNALMVRTMRNTTDSALPLSSWPLSESVRLGPIAHAWDLLGDGSLWALSTPGHTAGSIAVLARTQAGPVLVTGDTCHTRWGWDNGVAPGTFTENAEENRASLRALKGLADAVPGLVVHVGHELEAVEAGTLPDAG